MTARHLGAVLLAVLGGCAAPERAGEDQGVRAVAWNIWHGGREDGDQLGPRKVVDVLRESGADLVALQETYGSGELLSEALGLHFHPRGTNVSILSRWPIVEDVSVFEEFQCVGAIVDVPGTGPLAFYSLWLPYDAEIWEVGTRDGLTPAQLLAACAASARDLAQILPAIDARLSEAGFGSVPIVLAGDFNSMSHLDYTPAAEDQYGHVIDWPGSRLLEDAGYVDTYRALHPIVSRAADRTWTPRFPAQEQDRIDFVYLRTGDLAPLGARVVDTHPEGFPSDHAALVVRLGRAPRD